MAAILGRLERAADGIYSAGGSPAAGQDDEIRQRAAVAARAPADLLKEVSRHHSIRVMDRESSRFLRGIPDDGVVADIGGGWGWHWRGLGSRRPDVSVVIVDFVRENLTVAARLLGSLVNEQVFLVHGDATNLPFAEAVFDGYWSVQTLQHIPGFEQAVREAHRVLRPRGEFACYSLNRARLIESAYRLAAREYHVSGTRPGSFYLARSSKGDVRVLRSVFRSRVRTRFTEVLFHPDLKLYTGGETSPAGGADARLSCGLGLLGCVARQRSYHARKRAD